MEALIYLKLQHGPVIEQDDLDRLDLLRNYARIHGYAVSQVWPVHDGGIEPANEWWEARQDLADGRFKVIILWQEDQGVPDTILPEDLGQPAPKPLTLSTPCAHPSCGHPLNWHTHAVANPGCTVEGCGCTQFDRP